MTRRAALVLAAIVMYEGTVGKEVIRVWRRAMEFTAWHLIKDFESCKLAAYIDSGGRWTIGWGHTQNVNEGETCTQEQADLWLKQDVSWAVRYVARGLQGLKQVPQGVFDAMVDITYNVGSRVARNLSVFVEAGNWQGLCAALTRYVHDGNGKVLPGLVRRRKAEIALIEASIPGFKYQE